MPLAQYLKSFSRLRTDKNRNRWSELITYQAPHKPFMLLKSVISSSIWDG